MTRPPKPELHVSSLVVQHLPERTDTLREAVTALAGIDWHAAQNGKAIVTAVTATAGEVVDCIAAINSLPGVITTTLVYHHYEDAEEDAGGDATAASPVPAPAQ